MLKQIIVLLILIVSRVEFSNATVLSFTDSVTQKDPSKKTMLRFTTRMHSLGFFSYAGRIACGNPSVDLNFTYERKNWGYMLFKAADLYDPHSNNNFLLSLFYKNFKVNNRFTVTPYTGFILDQTHRLVGVGSDVSVIILTSFQFNRHLKIDNTTLFSNLVVEPEYTDWTNRIRLLYSSDHTDITVFAWHNNNVFDTSAYWSFGVSATYGRIKVSDHVTLSSGVTAMKLAATSNEEIFPKKGGIVFTIAAAVER